MKKNPYIIIVPRSRLVNLAGLNEFSSTIKKKKKNDFHSIPNDLRIVKVKPNLQIFVIKLQNIGNGQKSIGLFGMANFINVIGNIKWFIIVIVNFLGSYNSYKKPYTPVVYTHSSLLFIVIVTTIMVNIFFLIFLIGVLTFSITFLSLQSFILNTSLLYEKKNK